MSISLSNIILHQLKKNDDNTIALQVRNQQLTVTSSIEALVSEIHNTFSLKPSKGFGVFNEQSQLAQWLKDYQQQKLDFLTLSKQVAVRFKDELSAFPFASDGVLIIAEYHYLASQYLFVGLLESMNSIKVTEDLDISITNYLNVPKMEIVSCIDLSNWLGDSGSNRYLSCVQGRVTKKIADFFLNFWDAEKGLDAKQQNKVLMQAVDEYCQLATQNNEEKQAIRRQVFDYCQDQTQKNEDLQIEKLSEVIAGQCEPEGSEIPNFYQFTDEKGYSLAQSFPADKTTLRKLTKFVGAGGGISVNFSSELLNERVFFDPESDTLTINGIPPNLRDQLKRYLDEA